MVKVILMVKRKQGLSLEEFVRHYEEVHAPLAIKHIPTLKKYTRNFVNHPPGAEELSFDVITEFWYDDMEGYQKSFDFWSSEAGQVLIRDEETFMDRDTMIGILVDERIWDI